MNNFKTQQEIIEELNHFSDKLAHGDLSLKELEAYHYLVRNLYERVVVLQYKAKEKFIKEKPEVVKDGSTQEEHETHDIDNSSAHTETEATVRFDFTNIPDSSAEKKEEQIENESIQEVVTDEVTESPELPLQEDQTNQDQIINQKESTSSSDFFDQFMEIQDNSLLGKLGTAKINSLKGAFGLNDRLQMINELFDGDASEFQVSIETLDNLPSFEQAKTKLNEIAAQHQWEPDHLLVGDFVKMIQRRYV